MDPLASIAAVENGWVQGHIAQAPNPPLVAWQSELFLEHPVLPALDHAKLLTAALHCLLQEPLVLDLPNQHHHQEPTLPVSVYVVVESMLLLVLLLPLVFWVLLLVPLLVRARIPVTLRVVRRSRRVRYSL